MMTIVIGLLIPLLGTMLGSAMVFFMKDNIPERIQKLLLGFASGIMVAASVWSLLIPAMEMDSAKGAWSVVPAAVGFLLGIAFLLLIGGVWMWQNMNGPKPEARTQLLAQHEIMPGHTQAMLTLDNGETVTILDDVTSGGQRWLKVQRSDGSVGWVSADFCVEN